MSQVQTLQRLVRVRQLEEERALAELEAALADAREIEGELEAAGQGAREGRRMVHAGVLAGEPASRIAGLELAARSQQQALELASELDQANADAERMRQRFLACRVERRQAAALLDEAAAREEADQRRRIQQEMDDWHRNQRYRAERAQERLLAERRAARRKPPEPAEPDENSPIERRA